MVEIALESIVDFGVLKRVVDVVNHAYGKDVVKIEIGDKFDAKLDSFKLKFGLTNAMKGIPTAHKPRAKKVKTEPVKI